MEPTDYEQKKREFKKKMLAELFKTKKALVNYENDIFNYTFDHVYTLGKQEQDAEGEEMLCVSRERVQEEYRESIDKAHPYDLNSYNRGFYVGCATMLRDLFGSKCLPDEICNVASNVASKEPKPAEPKYHIGQRVRCLNDGETYIVLAKVGKCHYSLQGVEHDVNEDYLEPYTEPNGTCTDDCPSPCPSQDHIPDPAKMVDSIIKNGFRKHNRLHIAAMVIASIMGSSDWSDYRGATEKDVWRNMAKASLGVADALISESEKGGAK